jgi:regulation of enolase protein 1 (concanavalin A-like superfamily)
MNVGLTTGARLGVLFLLCTIVGISVAMAGPTTFISDDFNAYQLKRPLWTLVDRYSDCTIGLTGVNSGHAYLNLTTPGRVRHDIWANENNAPRILQACANEDFTVEAKFNSSLNGVPYSSYQAQGILVQADTNNFVRFDFTTSNQDSILAFSAAFIGGVSNPQQKIAKGVGLYGAAPMYLRVNRTGNTWTMMTSFNGTTYDTVGSFVQALNVSKIGLYGINAGTSPQTFTMVADYFMNLDAPIANDALTNVTDTQPPMIYSVQFKSAPDAIEVNWKTDEPSNGTIEYGSTTSYGSTLGYSEYTLEHRATTFGFNANSLYHFRLSGSDQLAHSGSSDDMTASTIGYILDTLTVSDGFNAATLDASLWTSVNPRGDATLSITGKQLSIFVPGGVEHQPWTTGNTAPRIVQSSPAAANVAEWTVKFNSVPVGSSTFYPMEGIYVEQDSNNFTRADFFSDGNSVYVFSASLVNGAQGTSVVTVAIPYNSAPLWLRLSKGGALWKVYWSADGISWNQAGSYYRVMTVNKVGVFAGNAGSAPQAFTALVDYFQTALPAKPLLNTPTAGATNVIRPVAFNWDTATGASTYRLQVSTASNFATTVFDSTFAGTSRYVSVLNPTTLYYWRVRGVNATGTGPYAASQNFTTAVSAPAAPTLVSPADNVIGITNTPTLIWTKPATATGYRLQVATDSTFAGGVVINDSTLIDTVTTTAALGYNTKYFWRVAAKNTGGFGVFSAVRRFTTRLATPPVPVLLSPAKGATDQPVSLTLQWNASEGATSYWVQLDTDTLFTAPLTVDDSTVASTSRAVSGLAHSTVYYWRVRAKNNGGNSAPSEIWSFTTVVAPPAQPTLLSPANGATGQLSSVQFAWTRPAGATSFRLMVATDSTFQTGVVYNDSTLADTVGTVSTLAYGQKYFWQVIAKNAGGASPASTVFSFFTLAADPTVPVQIEPANGSMTTQRTVTLRWTAPVGASSFHLQVGTNPTFGSDLIVDDAAVLDTTRVLTNLVYMTTYYWRVNADNIGGISPWSSTFSFTVSVPLPSTVTLIMPGNDALTSVDSTRAMWYSSSPLVDRYQIDLAADSQFTFRVTDSTITDTMKVFRSLINNQRYFWRVRGHNPGGWGPFSEVRTFTASTTVGINAQRELPTTVTLSQNYPNPFNPSTQIEFGLPKESHVTLEVYNILGERVATLVNETMSVGYHTVRFDASQMPSGLYIYRMSAGSTTIVHKMMLLK